MRIFRLNADGADEKFCFVEGAFAYDSGLQGGGAVLAEMKADGVDVLEYQLDETQGGLEIGDYFSTTTNHLPLSRRFADALATKFTLGPHELVPARIKNEKGRIHVKDAVIVNPLEGIDCLDWDQSELDGDAEDLMVRIFGKWSLKASRVPHDRDVFRVKGLIGYLFSERVVDFVHKQNFKNLEFEDAPLT